MSIGWKTIVGLQILSKARDDGGSLDRDKFDRDRFDRESNDSPAPAMNASEKHQVLRHTKLIVIETD